MSYNVRSYINTKCDSLVGPLTAKLRAGGGSKPKSVKLSKQGLEERCFRDLWGHQACFGP